MREVAIGKAHVSRLCIGGNPFSGFSHQTEERSREMVEYYTPDRIKETLRAAERAGINTFFGRTDDHTFRIVRDYWEEGGAIQLFAQVSPESDRTDTWRKWLKASIELGAVAAYIHGGVVDFWYANGLFDNFREALDMMREGGVTAGFAGHKPEAHGWIRDHLDVDFQMCSHYNATDRSKHAQHISVGEKWDDEDREKMLRVVATIERPVVHYKVFAAGNKPIVPAFEGLGRAMRSRDVVCIGFFTEDDPDMIAKDVTLFERYVEGAGTPNSG